MTERKTSEKFMRIDHQGCVFKRSLREDEYHILSDGEPLIPLLVVERLMNEVACMQYVRAMTNIPVPEVLRTYWQDGCYCLEMEYVDGVPMIELTEKERSKVIPQVDKIVATLHSLRSRSTGGPTDILCPPSIVQWYHWADWKIQTSPEEKFVFCHVDLSGENILVDRSTLKVVTILDWEYSGFFPPELEIPFYRSPETSGEQVMGHKFKSAVDTMIKFWKQSEISYT